MDRMPKAGELYRHFKNKMYQIVTVAIHSETREPLVIYQALYGDYSVYARPLSMFVSEVDHVKYPEVTQKYRFERVDPDTLPGVCGEKLSPEVQKMAEPASLNERDCTMTNDAANDVSGVTENPDVVQNQASEEASMETPAGYDKLMEFLDTEDFEKRYDILTAMWEDMTDGMIDTLAVVLAVVIPDGDLHVRYEALKHALRTRARYESNMRLR